MVSKDETMMGSYVAIECQEWKKIPQERTFFGRKMSQPRFPTGSKFNVHGSPKNEANQGLMPSHDSLISKVISNVDHQKSCRFIKFLQSQEAIVLPLFTWSLKYQPGHRTMILGMKSMAAQNTTLWPYYLGEVNFNATGGVDR